ncbi:uncharacterized protein LOC141863385 isoform X2 [Acropora palmata]|uniref:uncharacterized protein LOC141863385 isoform X2 n=1 Tax=Acropora palmata TaxID=6131 RepID=UPI003DA0C596
MQRGHLNEMATELLDTESGKGDSLEEERNRGDETTSSGDVGERTSYLQIPFGFQSRGSYKHASKNCEIAGVTYNSRFRQFVFLDSRGITSWSYESVYSTVTRHLNYPSYQFNVLRLITFSRKFNVYFALSKEYALKVFNLNFHEVFSVSADMHSVLCMVFNHVKNELITGGTGGMKFWTFGEIDGDKQKPWERYSRPMANYGLVLRACYPDMGGSWVKQVELDDVMQRLYCLSERNVVAYDMEGNLLFQITDAHRGPVTGCVYSKACNFLVTVGTDCDVNVWSRSKNGGKVHTFTCHSKAITKIMLHPESSALIITAALDGLVKVNSLDLMEEIYSLPVFSEGIYWMNIVSPKLIYCCSNRVIEVFSLNHLCDFWALSRCSVTSLSLVTCKGKSLRVMAIGNDSSVRLISRKPRNLSTVLPPPAISPLNMVKDVAYNREFNMMYLLIGEQEIWVYYTRTNPATRVESWKLDFTEDIHREQNSVQKSRASSPWPSDGNRSPSPVGGDSRPNSSLNRELSGRDSPLLARREKVEITCLGMLYSPIIMQNVEGKVCPDATQFLMAGTQDGRVLLLHMFWQGLRYHQFQANKDAVLQVYHDQTMGIVVTKCRHPGIVILIWSLPALELLKRIDCEADMTCFNRMNNLLLCGHKSGHLHLHSLAPETRNRCENEDNKLMDSQGFTPRDHQGSISSVDSNDKLEIFCSTSCDGVIKIWDRDKTLLREIIMDDTLTVASFLNQRGDILIGFKQHIFIIPNSKVYAVKDGLRSVFEADDFVDETFETESDIYEDPSVRFESKKILQSDPTDMENYLVPFPNLQLKTSWFMEGRPPVDLEQQNLREEKESISSMSSSLSLAPTEVYFSPTSTPRRLSMASSVAMSDQRRASTELWELPEFGDSPLSSPPRTPPPEPTPPPTPPPKEECEEEPGEEEKIKGEPQHIKEPTCDQCSVALKKEGKKNVPSIPTFRRGRMGDISIDSKSLRSGYDGPAYAAPVVRKVAVENAQPKNFKPGRAPKPVIKKTKKLKENEKQNAEKGSDIQEGGGDEIDSAEIKADKSTDDFIEERREAHNIVQTTNAHVQNIPEGHEWAVDGPDQFGTRHAKDAGATVQIEGHVQTRNVEVKATDVGASHYLRGMPEDHLPSTPYKTDDGNAGSVLKIIAKTEDENHIGDQTPELDERDDKSENTPQRKEYENRPERVLSRDAMHVVETNRYPEVEMPDDQGSAEILGRFDGDYGFESFVLPEASPGETVLSPPLPSKGSVRGHKRVSFRSRGGEKGRNSRQMSAGRNSPSSRVHSAGVTLKESVVPVYIGRRQSDMLNEISKDSMNVTPLTIFALARSRRENTETKYGLFVDERLRQKNETTEASRLRSKTKDKDIFEHSYGDYNSRLVGKGDLNGPDKCFENAALSRPSSVKKSESSLMRWCMRALKKAEREVLFPPKPTRPKSSSSCVNSGEAKKERGHTLYLNTNDNPQRPKTADTICSSTSSADEHSVFPYDNSFSTNETLRQKSRDLKSAAPLAQGGKWQQGTIEDDEDFMDAYRDMRASLGLQGLDEDLSKGIWKQSAELERRIPVIDTSDYYDGNWQIKVLQRVHFQI